MSLEKLEAAAQKWHDKAREIDVEGLIDCLDENGTWFDSFPMRFEGKKAYGDYIRWAMEDMVSATTAIHQVKCTILGKHTGLVTAHDHFTAVMSDGRKLRLMGRATFIFSNDNESGEYKLIHGHFSPQPVGAPS